MLPLMVVDVSDVIMLGKEKTSSISLCNFFFEDNLNTNVEEH